MPLGPGKYDDICSKAREEAQASGLIAVFFDGKYGSGFCVQAPLDVQLNLPKLLRRLADDIETALAGISRG